MVMEIITDFPERLKRGARVLVGPSHVPMTIESARQHSEGLVIKFDAVHSPEDAARYRNQPVYVTAADRPPLPEGHYYDHQLLGFAVVDSDSGATIGTLSEIMRTGANDIYVVQRPDESEVLLPVIPSVVLELNINERTIRVHLLPGLVEDHKS
jgi:16S rRNA processing protein RimM